MSLWVRLLGDRLPPQRSSASFQWRLIFPSPRSLLWKVAEPVTTLSVLRSSVWLTFWDIRAWIHHHLKFSSFSARALSDTPAEWKQITRCSKGCGRAKQPYSNQRISTNCEWTLFSVPLFSLKAPRSPEPTLLLVPPQQQQGGKATEPFKLSTWLKTRHMIRFCSEWHHWKLDDDKSTFSMSKWHKNARRGTAAIWSLETSDTTIPSVYTLFKHFST